MLIQLNRLRCFSALRLLNGKRFANKAHSTLAVTIEDSFLFQGIRKENEYSSELDSYSVLPLRVDDEQYMKTMRRQSHCKVQSSSLTIVLGSHEIPPDIR